MGLKTGGAGGISQATADATSGVVDLAAPDWSFSGNGASWINVWQVYWPGGACTFPLTFTPAEPDVNMDLSLHAVPITTKDQYLAASNVLDVSKWDPDPWTNGSNPNGGVIVEGVYALALYFDTYTERPFVQPDLPEGMLFAPAASATSAAVPLADATGVTTDSDTYDNTYTETGKIATAVFPQGTVAFAIALEGDAFPRWLFMADATDGIYVGDGTVDPYNDGVGGFQSSGDTIQFDALSVRRDTVYANSERGPVVRTPDQNHVYRLGVDDTGAVIATMIS